MECAPRYTGSSSDLDHQALEQLTIEVTGDTSRPVLMIDESNRAAGWLPLDEALASGRAFAVVPPDHLLAIDVDTAEAGWLRLADALAATQVEHVEVTSGGAGGRRHVWLSLAPDVTSHLRAQLAAHISTEGVTARPQGQGGAIRPPLSPHRTGSRGVLLSPSTVDGAVFTLGARAVTSAQVRHLIAHLDRPAQPIRVPVSGPLPEDIAKLLREGDIEGRYASTSEALWAVELAMANRCWDIDRVLEVLAGSALWPDRKGERYIRADYVRAQHRVAMSPAITSTVDAQLLIARMRASALTYAWPRGLGAAPLTLSKATAGLLAIAANAGRIDGLKVSLRQLSLAGSIGLGSAHRALRVLRAHGVLTQTDGAHDMVDRAADGSLKVEVHAPTYRINTTAACFMLDAATDDAQAGADVGADAWRWRGALCAAAWRLSSLLSARVEPQSEADLAIAYGTTSIKYLRRVLRRLEVAGLAVESVDGWRSVSRAAKAQRLTDLDSGTLAALALRYAAARANYQQWVADRIAYRDHLRKMVREQVDDQYLDALDAIRRAQDDEQQQADSDRWQLDRELQPA
jgi:hypothetical protein